jgi:hypothetical protein
MASYPDMAGLAASRSRAFHGANWIQSPLVRTGEGRDGRPAGSIGAHSSASTGAAPMPVGEGAASRSVLPPAGRNIKAPDRHWGEARRDLQVGARTNRPYGGEAWRAALYAAHAGRTTAAHSKSAKVRPATGGTGLRAHKDVPRSGRRHTSNRGAALTTGYRNAGRVGTSCQSQRPSWPCSGRATWRRQLADEEIDLAVDLVHQAG